ncbi:MAG: hypothetical protein WD602_07345 [Actinomycetota bacterium]
MATEASQSSRSERLTKRLTRALDLLEDARPMAKALYQSEVFEIAIRLLKEPDGPELLYDQAPRFESAGVFHGGDWDDPAKLQPRFVEAALTGHPLSVAIESLSQLRLLAVAQDKAQSAYIGAEGARGFLEQVLALNLHILFADGSYDHSGGHELREGVRRLVGFVAEHIGTSGILEAIVFEANRILKQKPILVGRVKAMIQMAANHVVEADPSEVPEAARHLIQAAKGPTQLSRKADDPESYRQALEALSLEELGSEIDELARMMRRTNLVSPQHAVAVRFISVHHPDMLPRVLGLDSVGRESYSVFVELVRTLIEVAVHPHTAQAALGLACLLERGTLFFPPVGPSLWRLLGVELSGAVTEALRGDSHDLHPQVQLVAGTVSVLGQPMGIEQGQNPTCQSARAISLWAQCDPGFLLELIARAVVDDEIKMNFEGQQLVSSGLAEGESGSLHWDLDPVSLLLVPHLDRIYAEMSRRVAGRGADGHRWINPEFHGFWVHRGFASPIEIYSGAVQDFESFLRLFYAAYHPYYNGGRRMIYPQPAGVAATNVRGDFLGWHAVAIERVALDPSEEMRVYFFDPNEHGSQDWGQGIETSTSGNGELAGESSLPFKQFAARAYVFHYNERDLGNVAGLPSEIVSEVVDLVRNSWASKFEWLS